MCPYKPCCSISNYQKSIHTTHTLEVIGDAHNAWTLLYVQIKIAMILTNAECSKCPIHMWNTIAYENNSRIFCPM